MPDLVESMKRAALEAVGAAQPVAVVFGDVVGTGPLRIRVDQKLTLGPAQLVLARSMTDYDLRVEVNHTTEASEGHTHAYAGEKTFRVLGALKMGERVLLLRLPGGQQYVVWDRVGL